MTAYFPGFRGISGRVQIEGAGADRSRRGDRAHWIIAALGGLLLLAPLAYWFFGTGGSVPTTGPSMRPTLEGPEPVEVDYEAYDHAKPALGDVVILQSPPLGGRACTAAPPPGSPCATPPRRYVGEYLIKRIVGLPDDEIAIAPDGTTIRNDERQAETFVRRCRPRHACALPRSITVPAGHYFVAGDNRRNSLDSRDFGPVPLAAVDGRVILEPRGR